MAQPPEDPQSVTNEVYGVYSDEQRQQVGEIWAGIITAQGLDGKDPLVQRNTADVVKDCLERGLKAQGRGWFRPSEQIYPFFNTGLQIRENILQRLRQEADTYEAKDYVLAEEMGDIEKISELSPDFYKAEEFLSEIRSRKKGIDALHTALFSRSQLSQEARALRPNLEISGFDSGPLSLSEKEWLTSNMLFANLLVNIALRKSPSLAVKLEDIVQLSRVWQSAEGAASGKAYVMEKISELAGRLAIPRESVKEYTESLLSDIALFVARPAIGLSELADANLFGVTLHDFQVAGSEFIKPEVSREIPQNELNQARSIYKRIGQKIQHMESLRTSSQKDRYFEQTYLPFLANLTPIEIGMVYYQNQHIAMPDIDFHLLEEEVPFQTFKSALAILASQNLNILETGQEITDLSDTESIKGAYGRVADIVLDQLISRRFIGNITFQEAIQDIPADIISRFLHKEDITQLTDEELQALYKLDTNIWYQIAIAANIGATNMGGETEIVGTAFTDSRAGEGLMEYFGRMPKEKQQEVAEMLLHIVSF